jgi:hypothetical protein
LFPKGTLERLDPDTHQAAMQNTRCPPSFSQHTDAFPHIHSAADFPTGISAGTHNLYSDASISLSDATGTLFTGDVLVKRPLPSKSRLQGEETVIVQMVSPRHRFRTSLHHAETKEGSTCPICCGETCSSLFAFVLGVDFCAVLSAT